MTGVFRYEQFLYQSASLVTIDADERSGVDGEWRQKKMRDRGSEREIYTIMNHVSLSQGKRKRDK